MKTIQEIHCEHINTLKTSICQNGVVKRQLLLFFLNEIPFFFLYLK